MVTDRQPVSPASPSPGSWTLSEKIGRMIMTGFRGMTLEKGNPLSQDIESHRIGGVILFDYDAELKSPHRNIESPVQVRSLIRDITRHGSYPLLIAVDQEGGQVARLKSRHGFPQTVSQRTLGETDNLDLTLRMAKASADTLADVGFNLNFAPLVDLNINPDSPAIGRYERSFSADPEVVIRHSRMIITTLLKKGITPVIKHFPGHGSAGADSHLGMVDVTESWNEQELIPYRQLIQEDLAPAIMSAHIYNHRLDSEFPATLSKRILTDLLRKEMNYQGVIISDDLDMKAISRHFGLETAVELAINAGIDILLFGNNLSYDPQIASRVHSIILDLIKKKRISEDRIDASFQRIMALIGLSKKAKPLVF